MIVVTLIFNQSHQRNTPISRYDQALLVRKDSPSRGSTDAPVTLVEFLDPECESCRMAYPIVEQILQDYDGRIRYVVRYFSNHTNSELAIAATEAAGEQGKYWEMQALLFTNQTEWGEQSTSQIDIFIRYAKELDLDVESFTVAIQNPIYLEKAQRDQWDANRLGIRGTPAFFINGRLVYGMVEESLRALIDEELGN